jgi:hypothetical protein
MAGGKFVVKVATALLKHNDSRILLQQFGNSWIFPLVVVDKGMDYKIQLNSYLKSLGISAKVGDISGLTRILLKNGQMQLRVNNVAFYCSIEKLESARVKWFDNAPRSKLFKMLFASNY